MLETLEDFEIERTLVVSTCHIEETVDDDGSLTELSNRADGSISIYCTENKEHKIPQDLQDELIDTYYEYY